MLAGILSSILYILFLSKLLSEGKYVLFALKDSDELTDVPEKVSEFSSFGVAVTVKVPEFVVL